ncbi:hypothetical protein AAHC03_010133 [Spirometra sp. Aus1]
MSTSYLHRKQRSVSPPRDLMTARKLKKRATVALMARSGAAATATARPLPLKLPPPDADASLPPPSCSVGEPLKAVPSPALLGPGCGPGVWPLRERLALASALLDTDNQQLTWPAISRRLGRLFAASSAAGRPTTWCSARACARQYALLLDSAELTKRTQVEAEHQASKTGAVAPPATLFLGDAGGSLSLAETIAKRLTAERVDELRGLIVASQRQHKFLKDKIAELESGAMEDQMVERLWAAVQRTCPGGGTMTADQRTQLEEEDGEVGDFLRELTSWPDPASTPAAVWTCTYGPSRAGAATGLPCVTKSSLTNSPSVATSTATTTPTRRTVTAATATSAAANEDQRDILKDFTARRSASCSLTNLVVEVTRKRLTGASRASCASAVEERLNALSPTKRSTLLRMINKKRKKRPGRPSREDTAARRMLFELANNAAADVAAKAAAASVAAVPPSQPELDEQPKSRSPDVAVAGSPTGSAGSHSTASTTVMWESDREGDESQPVTEATESVTMNEQPADTKVETERQQQVDPQLKEEEEEEAVVASVTDGTSTDALLSQPQVSLSPLKASSPDVKPTGEAGVITPSRRSGRSLSTGSSPPPAGIKVAVSPCKETSSQRPQSPPVDKNLELALASESGTTPEHRSLRLRLSRQNGNLTVRQVEEGAAENEGQPAGREEKGSTTGEGGQPSFSCSLTTGLRLRLSLSPLPSSGGGVGGSSSSSTSVLLSPDRETVMGSTSHSDTLGTAWERWASEILDAFQSRLLTSQRVARKTPRSRTPSQNLLFELAETLVLSAAQEAARKCTSAPRREVLVHRILLHLTMAALGSRGDSQRDLQLTPDLAQKIYIHMAPELGPLTPSDSPQLSSSLSPPTASPVENAGPNKNEAVDGLGSRCKRSSSDGNSKTAGKRRRE